MTVQPATLSDQLTRILKEMLPETVLMPLEKTGKGE